MKKDRYHHKDLKRAIIDTGIEIILADGIAELSIRNVAQRIGVSHTALYRHYKNKEDLLVSIAVRGFHELMKKAETAIVKHAGDPLEQLTELGRTYIRFAVDNSIYYRIMFGDIIMNKTGHKELADLYGAGFRNLVEIIKGLPGSKRKKDEEMEITALSAWSLLHGYSCFVIDNEKDRLVGSAGQVNLIVNKLAALVR